jgi:hypothetical protein
LRGRQRGGRLRLTERRRLTWDFAQAEPVQDRYWHIGRRPRGQVLSSLIRPDRQDRRRSRDWRLLPQDTYSKGRASGSRSAPAPSATPTYPNPLDRLAPRLDEVRIPPRNHSGGRLGGSAEEAADLLIDRSRSVQEKRPWFSPRPLPVGPIGVAGVGYPSKSGGSLSNSR